MFTQSRRRPVKLTPVGTAVGAVRASGMFLLFALAVAGAPSAVTTMGAPSPAPTVTAGQLVKFYVVRPATAEGTPEFLFDIARRTLGSGERAGEIFALTKGRLQPDGGRLADPGQIRPGWVLLLPDDASGPGIQQGRVPGAAPSAAPAGERDLTLPLVGGGLAGIALLGGATALVLGRRRTRDQDPGAGLPAGPDSRDGDGGSTGGGGTGGGDNTVTPPADDAWNCESVAVPQYFEPETRPETRPDPAMPPEPPGSEPLQDTRPDIVIMDVLPAPANSSPAASLSQTFPMLTGRKVYPSPDGPGGEDVAHEVAFGDDLVTLRLTAVTGPATAWGPLPHDAPAGKAVVCVGASPRGCLFLDFGTAPGMVGIEGPADAAARLIEAFVYQLATDTAGASVALVGDALEEISEGPRVRRVPGLNALAIGHDRSDLVIAVLPAGRDAGEAGPVGGPRIVGLKLGGVRDAEWSLTIAPGRAPRVWQTEDDALETAGAQA